MMRVLLPVLLLGQGSDAMRNPTKPPRIPPKDPPKASLEDPEAAMRPRRLQAHSFKNKAELEAAVWEWLDDANKAKGKHGHISTWDVSAVTDMSSLFSYEGNFNDDISKWITSSVTSMWRMFSYTESFNQDISKWDTARVTDMRSMFYKADAFDQDLGWCISSSVQSVDFAHEAACELTNCGVTFTFDSSTCPSSFKNKAELQAASWAKSTD